jgi:hypothetical protein
MGGYIGVGIVLLILGFGLAFLINDLKKRIDNSNKYKVCFEKSFKKCGLPLIKLKINSKLEWFLLDTGANANYLKKSYFDTIELKPAMIGKTKSNDSNNKLETADYNFELSYNKINFESEKFSVTTLNTFNEPFQGYDIVGIIGSPFFERNKWSFDFDELVVWINKK